MNNLASRYASALLSLALEENKNTEYRDYLKSINEVLHVDDQFIKLLECYTISKDEKKELIDKIIVNAPSHHINAFFKVIIDNNRAHYIKDIIDGFITLSNEKDGISEGYIYASSELSNDKIEKIARAIGKKINKNIYLKLKIDENLIGGFKVVINDYVFDASIKNKVESLKQVLLEGR